MARLDTYLTPTAFTGIKKTLQFANSLQVVGGIIALIAFLLSVDRPGRTASGFGQFSIESRALTIGLYVTLVLAPVVLSIGENPEETFLLLSEVLSIGATAMGVVAIAVVFQGYMDLTWPLLFTAGYLLNIPVLMVRVVPFTHISHRKRRGIPVGQYGNLNGIQMEMNVTTLKTLMVYAVLLGIPSSIVLAEFVSEIGVDGFVWNIFVMTGTILAWGVILGAALMHVLKGKTGWQKIILDTYENKVLWWYDSRGSLMPIDLPNPRFTSMENNQVKLSMAKAGASTDLKFYSSSDLHHFLTIVDPTRTTGG